MKKLRKYRWELAKLLIFDNLYVISPTLKCNQKCRYCCQIQVPPGEHKEHDYKWWIDFIDRNKFKGIAISGGEPALFDGVHHIINHCIERKMVISIVTNLKKVIPDIKKSWRVTFLASYHEGADLKTFMENYTELNKKFHVSVRELHTSDKQIIPFAKVERIKSDWKEGESMCPYINYYPDGKEVAKEKLQLRHDNFMNRLLSFLRTISGYNK